MSRRAAVSLLGLLLLGTARAAPAQLAVNLHRGAGSYRPEGSLGGGVASIAPGLRLAAGAFRWTGGGVYTDGRVSAQGRGQGRG
jgi:hypothetical protein